MYKRQVITEDITEDPKTAKLEKAEGLMVDKDGYIWFSDGNKMCIRDSSETQNE